MKISKLFMVVLMGLLVVTSFFTACTSPTESTGNEGNEGPGHSESGEGSGGPGEESGVQLTKTDTYNAMRNGILEKQVISAIFRDTEAHNILVIGTPDMHVVPEEPIMRILVGMEVVSPKIHSPGFPMHERIFCR